MIDDDKSAVYRTADGRTCCVVWAGTPFKPIVRDGKARVGYFTETVPEFVVDGGWEFSWVRPDDLTRIGTARDDGTWTPDGPPAVPSGP